MLTHIKQPAAAPAAAPAFEPSHHIGEAAAIVSEDEKIETIRTLRSENRGLQRKVEAQKLTLTLTLTLTLALNLTRGGRLAPRHLRAQRRGGAADTLGVRLRDG